MPAELNIFAKLKFALLNSEKEVVKEADMWFMGSETFQT